MILQRTSDDLGGTSASRVHQDDHRILEVRTVPFGGKSHVLVAHTALRIHAQLIFADEFIDDFNRLIEQTPGVIPEVEHQAGDLLLLQVMEGLFEFIRCSLVKIPHPDVADVVIQFALRDAPNLDDVAGNGKVLRRVKVVPHDGDRYRRASGATHLAYGVEEGNVLRNLPIDLDNAITGLESGAERRSILDRGHHGQEIIANGNLNAQSTKLPLGFDLHLFVHLWG